MKGYPLIAENQRILAGYNNMPNTKAAIKSQASVAFYLSVSVRTMTAEDIKLTKGNAAGFSTSISNSTKKVRYNGNVMHEYFTTDIAIHSNAMNYGTISEEFLHAGQKLYYKEKNIRLPNEVSIELEAKVIKIYAVWEQNQSLSAPQLYNEMLGMGIQEYELDILFNWSDKKDENGNIVREVTFDEGVKSYFEKGGDVAFADAQAYSNALTKAGAEVEKTYQNKPLFRACCFTTTF